MLLCTEADMSIEGKRFALAGRLSGFTHSELQTRLERLGARVTSAVGAQTDYVVAGAKAGAKRQQAVDRGVAVIDLDDLLRLMDQAQTPADGAAPAAGEARFPRRERPQRDGTYRECYGGGYRVRVQGELDAGKRVGTWRWYYPDGQLQLEIDYVNGSKHGAERKWYDNGKLAYEGAYADGHRVGAWVFYYKNGKLKEQCNYDSAGKLHGELAVYKGNGELKYRGGYLHGDKHGDWEGNWNDRTRFATEKGHYERGQSHGEFLGWYENGQLACRRQLFHGDRHGELVEYYEDGSPKLEEHWRYNRPVGERRSWDPEGNETVEHFIDGVPKEVAEDTALMERTAKKLAKASDAYAMEKVLRKAVDRTYANAFFVHLVRAGLLDPSTDPNLLALLENRDDVLTASDVISVIKKLPFKQNSITHVPHWPIELDKLTMRIYPREPEVFREALDRLPKAGKLGVASVMARLGEDVSGLIDDPTDLLANQHARRQILSILWPHPGYPKFRDTHDKNGPTAWFTEFLERFADADRWPSALLEALLKTGRKPIQSNGELRPAFEVASPEQMAQLAGRMKGGLKQVLLQWRDDSAQEATDIAMALKDERARAEAAACAAIKWGEANSNDTGEPVPDRLVQAMQPKYGSFPRAARALSQTQLRSLIEPDLESFPKSGAYLYLVDDRELWRRYFEQLAEDDYFVEKMPAQLATLPQGALPIMADVFEQAKEHVQTGIYATITHLLGRAGERGETWDERWDEFIRFDPVLNKYHYDSAPFQRVLSHLPTERAAAVLRREMGRARSFARAFRCLPCVLDQEVAEYGFTRLVERESKLSKDDLEQVQAGLKEFPNVRPWIKWAMREGAGSFLRPTFNEVLGSKAVDQLEREVKAGGAEVAEALDLIGRIDRLAKDAGGGDHTIYVLREQYAKPDDAGYNQIGGMPPGIDVERWPTFDDQPMVHLFTLDVDTMPAMRGVLGDQVRTVSVFCHNPELNEATSPGNAWTAVVTSTDEEISGQPIARPKGVAGGRPRYFEPVAVEVSPRVWKDDPEDRLRNAIFQAHARVLGEPIAIQEDIHMDNLLVQFDERFVDINLGDSGVMYVFEDTAFWQCY